MQEFAQNLLLRFDRKSSELVNEIVGGSLNIEEYRKRQGELAGVEHCRTQVVEALEQWIRGEDEE